MHAPGGLAMILPDPAIVGRGRRSFLLRLIPTALALGLVIAAALLPHVSIAGATGNRSLIPTSQFFVLVDPTAPSFGAEVDRVQLAVAINVIYLGLAAQQVGSAFALGSFWVLAQDDVGKWMRRFLMVGGWFLAISAPLVLTGYSFLLGSGATGRLGMAWMTALLAGLIMIIGGLAAKKRLSSTWFWTRPELL
jgi:hypothetical protein